MILGTERGVRKVNIFLYGPTKVGKTHFIGTGRDDTRSGPVLVIDVENRAETLAKHSRYLDLDEVGVVEPKLGFVDVVVCPDPTLVGEVIQRLYDNPKHGYKTVALDSASELNKLTLGEAVGLRKPTYARMFKPGQALGVEGAARAAMFKPVELEQRDYGKSNTFIESLVRGLKNLPVHVIVTAHTKEGTNKKGRPYVSPQLTGQLQDSLPGMFGILAYYFLDGVDRVMAFAPGDGYSASIAYQGHSVPDEASGMTFPALLDLLGGAGEANK